MSTIKHGVSKSDSFNIIFDFFAGLVPDFDALFFALVFGIFSLFYTHAHSKCSMLFKLSIMNSNV